MKRRSHDSIPSVTHTGTGLLRGLGSPGHDTLWHRYVERYRPILLSTLRRSGVPEADAEDLVQLALGDFAAALRSGEYRRERGRLRSWMFGILNNHVRAWRRRANARPEVLAEEEVLSDAPTEGDELELRWEAEWRQEVLRRTLDQVRSELPEDQWRAFELFTLEGCSAQETAERLGTTPTRVYGAKRRALERIRALRPLMQDLE